MMSTLALTCLLLCSPPHATETPPEPPIELRLAQEARSRLVMQTARIAYSTSSAGSGEQSPSRRFYEWRCAGGDIIVVDLGDEHGVLDRRADGQPDRTRTYAGARHLLYKDDELWMKAEGAPAVNVFTGDKAAALGVRDLRRLGLDAVYLGHDVQEAVKRANVPLTYEVAVETGVTIVSAITDDGRVEWHIDPEKDWSVARTAIIRKSGARAETRYELAQFDGLWFPRRATTFRSLDGGPLTPVMEYDVTRAEFNRGDHPAELRPEDIGVETGTQIDYVDKNCPSRKWDGRSAVGVEEYFERAARGELVQGARVTYELARLRALSVVPPDAPIYIDWAAFETQWETYTRRFIERYRLQDDQAARAWALCNKCQELGGRYVHDRRDRLESLDRNLREAETDRDLSRLEQLAVQRTQLTKPLYDIFHRRLKPGLDELPTAEQRKAVDGDTEK
ncbi:MAG: hypothetical protein LC135_11990 [Phycisphaerae bacterium]|jgi:hypothetical protein|nr:hypothetical protein [Phycisphaerae bacterium]MCZ2400570.1 hypothetical protein [Phycisphaerae bacterium]NUQ49213.1 hypothetical protein [Phycisphaerae bacterium]